MWVRPQSFLSLEELPAELTAARWRALEGRVEWSPGHRAFLFHPDRPETAPEAPPPPAGAPAAVSGLRPAGFEDFVGQRQAVENLVLAGRAARERGEPLGHTLLGGPAGLGKTSLARLLAGEFGSGFQEIVAGNIGDPHQLISFLVRLRKDEHLFIDEVHRIDKACEEALYSALEDRVVSIVLREGGRTRTVRIRLEPFTLVAATTRVGALSEPFRARFRHQERLEGYAEEELAEVAARAARRLGTPASLEAALEIARRSRGTPREAIRILEVARDVAQLSPVRGIELAHVGHDHTIELAHVGQAAERLGIDAHGLGRVERAAVELLLARGRPMGREALAARLGVDIETFREVNEPWLERAGLIERTEWGRAATAKARRLYGAEAEPEGSDGSDGDAAADRAARISAWRELDELIPVLWGAS